MGLYQRPDSDVFWISYTSGGKCVRESTGSRDREEAKRLLKDKEGRTARGEPILPRADKILYAEARADLLAHYTVHGTRDVAEATARLLHLDQYFAGRRMASIGPADITAYAQAPRARRLRQAPSIAS